MAVLLETAASDPEKWEEIDRSVAKHNILSFQEDSFFMQLKSKEGARCKLGKKLNENSFSYEAFDTCNL